MKPVITMPQTFLVGNLWDLQANRLGFLEEVYHTCGEVGIFYLGYNEYDSDFETLRCYISDYGLFDVVTDTNGFCLLINEGLKNRNSIYVVGYVLCAIDDYVSPP